MVYESLRQEQGTEQSPRSPAAKHEGLSRPRDTVPVAGGRLEVWKLDTGGLIRGILPESGRGTRTIIADYSPAVR
ncbi:MAG: hypothetical protein Q8O15_05120 [Rectinemataceae bacterium]|nr:hypothetical protein [Rectinemataceae bacterium]